MIVGVLYWKTALGRRVREADGAGQGAEQGCGLCRRLASASSCSGELWWQELYISVGATLRQDISLLFSPRSLSNIVLDLGEGRAWGREEPPRLLEKEEAVCCCFHRPFSGLTAWAGRGDQKEASVAPTAIQKSGKVLRTLKAESPQAGGKAWSVLARPAFVTLLELGRNLGVNRVAMSFCQSSLWNLTKSD